MMDGNYANTLDAIVLSETLTLNSFKDKISVMDDQDKTIKVKSQLAMLYKVRNWDLSGKKLCNLDIYYSKKSNGD